MSQTHLSPQTLPPIVAGYSRLIGVDEGGTLQRLKAIRAELFDPKIAEHHGRLVKTTGGSFLHLLHKTTGLYFSCEYETMAEATEGAIRSYPNHPGLHRSLAAALGQIGPIEEAKEAPRKIMSVAPPSFRIYVRNRLTWVRPDGLTPRLVYLPVEVLIVRAQGCGRAVERVQHQGDQLAACQSSLNEFLPGTSSTTIRWNTNDTSSSSSWPALPAGAVKSSTAEPPRSPRWSA
jgi:hypothetical protein